MFDSLFVLLISIFYILMLFVIAYWVEGKTKTSKKISSGSIVYSLALAVYCTSWTYYGSVGKATTSGMLFLTVYLGPTLSIILWWVLLRKMIRIKEQYRVTSIADFISARYDKSQMLASFVTIGALVGTMPYIALQIKSVTTTFKIITTAEGVGASLIRENLGFIVISTFALFTIIFGLRRLDPTERHPGMITAVAVESLIKLVAFLACGVFVTFFLYDGFADIFNSFSNQSSYNSDAMIWGSTDKSNFITWATWLILGMSAIIFLPRQFHVGVIENHDEKHVRTAMWLFPLYLLLINLFVVPIAIAGMMSGIPQDQADIYVLKLPMLNNQRWLALFVYLGGLSAATSMVIISSLTLATMITNHLVLPCFGRYKRFSRLNRYILQIRWLSVVLVVLIGFWFEQNVGESYMLVNMGIISFAAAIQFAPTILGGIFWRRGSKAGAMSGLCSGFLVWFYTLFIPTFIKSGWVSEEILVNGPWGITFLKPEQLFGLSGLDPLSHTLFWSMFFNIGIYVLISLVFEQSGSEREIANLYVDILRTKLIRRKVEMRESTVNIETKIKNFEELLRPYFDKEKIQSMIEKSIMKIGVGNRNQISLIELAELQNEIETILAGSIGAATAHQAIMSSAVFSPQETEQLYRIYADMLVDLRVAPEELAKKIDYYREREALTAEYTAELEQKVKKRTFELEVTIKELEAFSYSVSHDLRAPLRHIDGFSKALVEDYGDQLDDIASDYLDRIQNATQHMGTLIENLLSLSRLTRAAISIDTVDLSNLIREIIDEFKNSYPDRNVEIIIQDNLIAKCDPKFIRIMFTNLVDNAWKFTSKKEIARIEFGCRQMEDERVFHIKDNGVGFDMTYASKLFSPFHRLHSSEEYAGTGIGLATVRRIIHRHSGRIWADAEVGKGASFFFTLPEIKDSLRSASENREE
ncbi:MAG: ATP-binding protein [Candidatus Odinarchaeota archaeon]